MSQVITCNAHAQTHTNSELPMVTPSDLPHTLECNGPFVSPTTSPPAPVCLSHTEEHVDNQGNPSPHTNTRGPEIPSGDPDPSDDEPDGDEQCTEESNNDDLFEAHGGANNLTVLLCILGPILAEHQSPPHTPPVAPLHPRRLKVNLPEEFNGRSPKKLKSFLVSCNHAFCVDPDTFCRHDKHVSYALSYLCRSVQCHFDTQLKDEEDAKFIPPD